MKQLGDKQNDRYVCIMYIINYYHGVSWILIKIEKYEKDRQKYR